MYGKVEQPLQGTNAFGGVFTSPETNAQQITDLGHDPNAGS